MIYVLNGGLDGYQIRSLRSDKNSLISLLHVSASRHTQGTQDQDLKLTKI